MVSFESRSEGQRLTAGCLLEVKEIAKPMHPLIVRDGQTIVRWAYHTVSRSDGHRLTAGCLQEVKEIAKRIHPLIVRP